MPARALPVPKVHADRPYQETKLAGAKARRVRRHLRELGLKTAPGEVTNQGFAADAMLTAMRRDKKASQGRITFVLLQRLGQAFTSDGVDAAVLQDLLERPV